MPLSRMSSLQQLGLIYDRSVIISGNVASGSGRRNGHLRCSSTPTLTSAARGGLLASLVTALLLGPAAPAGAAPAEAAPSTCARHYPGGAAPDIIRPALAAEVRELCFEAFAVLHSGVSRTPLAAAEHLTRRSVQQAADLERDSSFHAEARPPEDERARLVDYARSGFDRGHLAPSGDMPTDTAQQEGFSLANIVPQDPGSNRCLWEGIESTVRELAANEGEAWVLTGPIFEGAELRRLNERVLVPTSLFKAVYMPGRRQAGAYVAPNAPGLTWQAVSLDALREIAGLDAFPSLPAAVKARAMALPEPQPSNIRGSCDDQPPMVASAEPLQAQSPAGARQSPPVSTSPTPWWEGLLELIGSRAAPVLEWLSALLRQ